MRRALFDFVATEGGPVSVVFKMLANLLPEYASLAIPLGLMLGVLLAFRRLATSSELDVMRAVGLSYTRLLRVPYLFTVVLAALNLLIVGWIFSAAFRAITTNSCSLIYARAHWARSIKRQFGEFNTLQDRTALRVDASRDEGARICKAFSRGSPPRMVRLVVSRHARGNSSPTRKIPSTVVLRLSEGQIVQGMVRGSIPPVC